MASENEVDRICQQLDQAYNRGAWIGPTVMSTLDGVTAHGAALRPLENAHTIWEITNHITFWDNLIRRMLEGEKINSDEARRNDWAPVLKTTEEDWHVSLLNLQREHEALAAAVTRIDAKQFNDKSNEINADFTVYEQLHGIIQHNIYHAGQIGMLKKSTIFPPRRGPLRNATAGK